MALAGTLAGLGAGLAVAGCMAPDALTAPTRQPRMLVMDRERIPLPIAVVPTGAAAFDWPPESPGGGPSRL